MPLLFPALRINQVFGANTDVGKTLLTTALVRASASKYAKTLKGTSSKRVFYLKPVSTGPDSESDVAFVQRNTTPYATLISTKNLYQYREPMSPHLAAQRAPDLPFPKTNETLVRRVSDYALSCAQSLKEVEGCLFVETAGGVHSPSLHLPYTQSTSLRSLLLPAILVASPHLGGISTTVSAYESLLLRGYTISAVLCLHDAYYRNDTFLRDYFTERGVKFYDLPPPPKKEGSVQEDSARLGEWYKSLEGDAGVVTDVVNWLDKTHKERIEELESMPQRTLDSVWWPFTQHGLVNKKEDVMVIDSAHGDHFDAYYTPNDKSSSSTEKNASSESMLKPYFDGSASWFTQSHGHAAEPLTLAAAEAAGRYGHVLFPSGTHKPALDLAEKLIETVGKGWASRVFYSDNGSTGMEVALKMGLRASGKRYGWSGELGGDVGVIGLRGSYHGDTIGAMDATEASTYNTAVDWYKGRGFWFAPPLVSFQNGRPTITSTPPDAYPSIPNTTPTSDGGFTTHFSTLNEIYDVSSRQDTPLAVAYRDHIRKTLEVQIKEKGRKFGCLVLEPICLGAGGMAFVDPLFQACLVQVVRASEDLFSGQQTTSDEAYKLALKSQIVKRQSTSSSSTSSTSGGQDEEQKGWSGLPVIYDEVFSGLNRFGYTSAASILGVTPDIAAYAKILTGGLLPLSTTLASPSIFEAFISDKKVDALLHGHSYTANPIGCSVALKAIEMSQKHELGGGWDAEKEMWKAERNDGYRNGIVNDDNGGMGVPSAGNRWSFWSLDFVEEVSRTESVKGAMAMGTVFALELEDKEAGYASHTALNFLTSLRGKQTRPEQPYQPFQIHSRPLGNVCYLMTSLFTKPEVIRGMEKTILEQLRGKGQ